MLRLALPLVLLVLTGCAGYRLTPLATDRHDANEEGYVFYAPEPFLMGSLKPGNDAAHPQYEFKIVYLPDRTRPYRFTRYETLAKSDLKITFTDGWLFTGAESKTDTTAVLSTIVDLAKLAALRTAQQSKPLDVLLFRIMQTGDGYELREVPVTFTGVKASLD